MIDLPCWVSKGDDCTWSVEVDGSCVGRGNCLSSGGHRLKGIFIVLTLWPARNNLAVKTGFQTIYVSDPFQGNLIALIQVYCVADMECSGKLVSKYDRLITLSRFKSKKQLKYSQVMGQAVTRFDYGSLEVPGAYAHIGLWLQVEIAVTQWWASLSVKN